MYFSSSFLVFALTMMNGVNGYVVCGRGGYASASIFLSAADYGYGTSFNGYGSYGLYWLSVPYSDGGSAWCLRFRSGGHGTDGYCRSYGCSIRPVQEFYK